MAILRFSDKEGNFDKKTKPKYHTYKRYLYVSVSLNFALILTIVLIVNKL